MSAVGHTWMVAHHEEIGTGKRAHAIAGLHAAALKDWTALCGVAHPGGGCWSMLGLGIIPSYCEKCQGIVDLEAKRDEAFPETVGAPAEYHGGYVMYDGMRLVVTIEGHMLHVAWEHIR